MNTQFKTHPFDRHGSNTPDIEVIKAMSAGALRQHVCARVNVFFLHQSHTKEDRVPDPKAMGYICPTTPLHD
jgi:hypothetical protein